MIHSPCAGRFFGPVYFPAPAKQGRLLINRGRICPPRADDQMKKDAKILGPVNPQKTEIFFGRTRPFIGKPADTTTMMQVLVMMIG